MYVTFLDLSTKHPKNDYLALLASTRNEEKRYQ